MDNMLSTFSFWCKMSYGYVLSCFNCVDSLWDPIDCSPPTGFFCPLGSPGENTRVGFHTLLQGSFWARDQNSISYVSCIGRQVPCHYKISSVQFSSVAQLCPTLCDLMNRSTPGLPVHHQLLEFTQTHVHHVSDAVQPSHPL